MSNAGLTKANHGERKQSWGTPQHIIDYVQRTWDFITVDVCADEKNTKCCSWFGIDDDGLIQPWAERPYGNRAWCNPPFEDIEPWVRKAISEMANGVTTTMLLPTRTGQPWWELCATHGTRYYLRKRLKFEGAPGSFAQDCMLVRFVPNQPGGAERYGLVIEPQPPRPTPRTCCRADAARANLARIVRHLT